MQGGAIRVLVSFCFCTHDKDWDIGSDGTDEEMDEEDCGGDFDDIVCCVFCLFCVFIMEMFVIDFLID